MQRDGALAESFPVGLEPQVEAYESFETPFDKRGSHVDPQSPIASLPLGLRPPN